MTATATAPRKTQKNATTREVLTNPFKVGEQITIPSGTVFTSTAPSAKGRQVVKRSHKVTVLDTIPARVQPRNSATGAKFLVRPVRVRAKGSGGYWKDITLTEKIVRLNGKPLSYETISLVPATAEAKQATVEPTAVTVEPVKPIEPVETTETNETDEAEVETAEPTEPAPTAVTVTAPVDILFSSTANSGE